MTDRNSLTKEQRYREVLAGIRVVAREKHIAYGEHDKVITTAEIIDRMASEVLDSPDEPKADPNWEDARCDNDT